MKAKLFTLFYCFVGSIAVVITLTLLSKQGFFKNDFLRLLPSNKIKGKSFLNIKYNTWYFAGADKHDLYLGNVKAHDILLKTDFNFKCVSQIKLKAADTLKVFSGAQIKIDDLNVYLFDGIKPIIIGGNLSDYTLKNSYRVPYFTSVVPISRNSFIFRCVNFSHCNYLMKQNANGFRISSKLLEKQIDGLFCTDGKLIKVPNSNKVVYTYYYRNQFIVADTNLNLLYKGKTIDTVAHAHVKVAKIQSLKELTLAAPPLYVNQQSCANEKFLFIHSALKADNETDSMHEKGAVVDVYSVNDGKYQLSFYLPDFNGEKMTDFRVYGHNLIAMYSHYLYKYQLYF